MATRTTQTETGTMVTEEETGPQVEVATDAGIVISGTSAGPAQ